MKLLLKVILLVLFSQILFGQSDNIGSGRAITFDGVDDFVNLGNVYDDLKLPVTISAWVNIDQSVATWAPVFVSQDNSSIYNGFWLIVQPTRMSIGYGGGEGENNEAFRRSKAANFLSIGGRWVHLSAVIRGAIDMDLYVNGINVGGEYSGSSDLPMSSSAVDDAKIGYWFSNQQVFRFKGSIDEVRLWNRSLSQSEIRNAMCKQIQGTSNGLIGLWNFNETDNQVLDQSPSSFNGVLQGSPLRQFSGAPIGNESQINYTSSWASQNFNFSSSPTINISNVTGAPEGIHVYKVHSSPGIQTGLTSQAVTSAYYGVFLASLDNNNRYTIEFLNQNASYCNLFSRISNNSITWSLLVNPQIQVLQRGEYLIATGIQTPFDLGDRIQICAGTTQNIDTGITDANVTFLWNTGETTRNILVTTGGIYSVEVTGPCGSKIDQVEVVVSSPPSFDLGDRITICQGITQDIDTGVTDESVTFLWNTGATTRNILVNTSGTFSVVVTGPCGTKVDHVEVITIPPVLVDLGERIVICEGITQNIDTGITDTDATFLWSTGATTRNILVNTTGTYSVEVTGPCGSAMDHVEVYINSAPPYFSFGDDEVLCTLSPTILRPYLESRDYEYLWQDGSTGRSVEVLDFGDYWVEVKNSCGIRRDTITYSKLDFEFVNIPNVITPNGDLDNEFFQVTTDTSIQPSIVIIDRWGLRVYDNPSYKNDWNASGLSPGVYYYRLTGPCIKEAKGSISVLR
jgi:hypothetical protein